MAYPPMNCAVLSAAMNCWMHGSSRRWCSDSKNSTLKHSCEFVRSESHRDLSPSSDRPDTVSMYFRIDLRCWLVATSEGKQRSVMLHPVSV